MLDLHVQKMKFQWKNTIISRVVNLDHHLDLLVLISVKDTSFWELFLNKILDSIIDRISIKDTYNDFSTALENINSFLSTWRDKNDNTKGIHAFVGILNQREFLFSTVGSPSCYLINTHSDVIEVTDKQEDRKNFWFILNGEVNNGETIMFSTTRILNYLSKGDIIDSCHLDDLNNSNANIETIMTGEKPWKNVGLISFRYKEAPLESSESRLSELRYQALRYLDNTVVKTILAYFLSLKKFIFSQSKNVKNIVFLWGMIVCAVFLYVLLSGFVNLSSGSRDTELAKQELLKAREYVRLASENIANEDIFSLHIENGESILKEIASQNLFSNDVDKIEEDISVLKKQFNGIETFLISDENTLYTSEGLTDPIKVVSVAWKLYLIDTQSVVGPIIGEQDPEVHVFEDIQDGDQFIDASVQDTNIILLTSGGKVVNFAKNNFFTYLDVADQPTWEESNILSTYGQNLYLLDKARDQIYRHKKVGGIFQAGDSYIAQDDVAGIGTILSLAIDGGIYILKQDLSIVKLFVSPQYRLESITLNQLPKNYDRQDDTQKVSLHAAANLNYVYMLLDNRLLIFQPNTTRFQDTKSLKYIGQVEPRDFDIKEFHVANDKEVFLLGDTGLYKMRFEVNDDKLLVR